MKQSIAFGLFTGAALFAVAIPASAAESTAEDWDINLGIYAYLPTISGSSRFAAPSGGSGASVDIDQILENLKFTFMGTFSAQKGALGLFADAVYMDIGDTQTDSRALELGRVGLPADVNAQVEFDMKGFLLTMGSSYRITADPAHSFDLVFGARMLDIEQTLKWQLTGNVGSIPIPSRSGDPVAELQNWDAIVGFKGRFGLGATNQWFIPYYADIGTGDSDLTWQAMGGLGYAFKWGDVVAAWRYVDYSFESDSLIETINFNGPALAAVFRW